TTRNPLPKQKAIQIAGLRSVRVSRAVLEVRGLPHEAQVMVYLLWMACARRLVAAAFALVILTLAVPWGVGIEKWTGGHALQLNISNSFGTTPGQIARGGSEAGVFPGFNITRKL